MSRLLPLLALLGAAGAAAREWPGSLWEGVGQVKSREATVKRRRAVLPVATERPHSTSNTDPGAHPSLAPRPSPAARPAGTEESPGNVLSDAAIVAQMAWLGRREKGTADGTNMERAEPLVTADPWDKAHQGGVLMHPSAAGQGMLAGKTGSPLFSTRPQFKAEMPTSVPLPGTVPLGNTRAKDATSRGGSTSQPESPTVFPGSAAWEVVSWDRAPSSPSPVYTSGQSALPPGASETPGAALARSEPPEETSRDRAVDTQEPVTLLPPSAPRTSPTPWASAGDNGAPRLGGGAQGVGMVPREAAVTVDLDLTDLGVGATEASGPDLSPGTLPQGQTELAVHAPASASGDSLQPSPTPAPRPNGWKSLAWQLGGRAASLAQPTAETGGTPVCTPASRRTEPLATTAHPVPGDQTMAGAGTQRWVPLGTRGPGEGLDPTLAGIGSEQSPGRSGVDGFPENMDLSLSNDTRTEGDPRAVSWAESLARTSPASVPSAYARTQWPLANLSAPATSSGSAQPLLAVEQLSTWADASRPTAPGQENASHREPAPEQPSSDSWTLTWLPDTPPERTRVPGTKEPRSMATSVPTRSESVGTSSQPPVSSTPGAKQPSLAPAPGVTMTTQEEAFPGASSAVPSSGNAMPHSPGTLQATGPLGFQPPPASQTARVDLLPATLQDGSMALSPTEPAAASGPRLSFPSSSEKEVSASPSVLGLAELSVATTQSPAWFTVTTDAVLATSSSASWLGETERLGQQAATSPAWAAWAGSEPGNSSQAPDAPAPSGAGRSFSSSSTGALFSPTATIPELILTAESAGSPAGSRSPWPPLAVTPRAWSTDVMAPASSTRADAPFTSTQLGATMPPMTPGPAGATDGQSPPTTTKGTRDRAQSVFVVEDQPPLLKAASLRVPCELTLDMEFIRASRAPTSHARRSLVQSFNETVVPLFAAVPGFQRLEVKRIREGGLVLEYDALFAAERVRWQVQGLGALLNQTLLSGAARRGLHFANATVLRNVVLERQLDLCSVLFSCRAGFVCFTSEDGNASCTSLCHRDYCKNHGICTHPPDHAPVCQCPTGSDYWFMGLRCDYQVTRQSLLGMAGGLLLTMALVGAAVACLVMRRFKALLLEAQVDQTRSSYRRFCRLDDVVAPYWSPSWLASANSLDNPAFSNSEELLHLQVLDGSCCSCKDDVLRTARYKPWTTPPSSRVCSPSFHYDWDTSSNSINDPMIDSGKASDISVSSWPMEPIQWTPFPILHQLSRQRPPKTRRPHSYCEGTELVNLERSWTA